MNNQLMLVDLLRTSQAFLEFALILLVPGYVVAWLLNLLQFRQRTLITRLTLAVPISIGICPIATDLLWRFAPPALWLFYGTCAIAFVVLAIYERQKVLSRAALIDFWKRGRVFLAIVAGWVVVAELTLVDLQIGQRLYFPTVTYDYNVRTAVTASITRGGVPPHNPFFFPGRLFVLHYHYFWLALCSVAQRITGAGTGARYAVLAGTIWCGMGLMAVVALYLRFFQKKGAVRIERRTLMGWGLLAVTGLDVIPVLLIEWISHGFYGDFEWWNDQVAAWLETVLWTPHHLAGLIACLTGFLVLWDGLRLRRTRERITMAVTAGVMFAGAVGLTVYVTLVFAIFLAVWMAIELWRKHFAAALLMSISGLVAATLAVPFLSELLARAPGAAQAAMGGSGVAFTFAVRRFRFYDEWLGLAPGEWKTNLANLMVLPINYGIELGFFLIAGVIQLKTMWRNQRNRQGLDAADLCTLAMAAASLVICTFVSSAVTTANDLGWRGFLVAQFVLLIWGAELLADGLVTRMALSRDKRVLIVATLVLGVAGTLYAWVKVRFYPLMSDFTSTPLYTWLSPDRNLGARTYALRQIYDQLRSRTAAGVIYQHNPRSQFEDFFHGVYADRQEAAEGMGCHVNYGGDANLCSERIGRIDALFEDPAAIAADRIDDVCAQLSIDVLIVKDTDQVWRDRTSWVWKRKPVVANGYARAFMCGPQGRPAPEAPKVAAQDGRGSPEAR